MPGCYPQSKNTVAVSCLAAHRPREASPPCRSTSAALDLSSLVPCRKGRLLMAMDITLIVRTLTPVVQALEQLAIPYHIGGSVASSLYGEFRPTQDVDIVADLHLTHARSFVKLLEGDYYIVEDAVRD